MAVIDGMRPIRNEREYEAAVARTRHLLRLDAEPFSAEDEELHALSLLIEDYEEREHSIDAASPQAVVELMLEAKGLTRADLHDVMGGRSRVSEFFSGTRPLSMSQLRGLRSLLGIPADALLGPE